MEFVDILVIAIVLVIVGLAGWYVYRARKKGVKCIGCPQGRDCGEHTCGGSCSGCSGNCGES